VLLFVFCASCGSGATSVRPTHPFGWRRVSCAGCGAVAFLPVPPGSAFRPGYSRPRSGGGRAMFFLPREGALVR